MRFEIGPGGAFVILLGLAGLSGGVFALGLLAGHEMARPDQNEAEQAAVYPLPNPPAAEPSPGVSYTAPPISGGASAPSVAANNPSTPGLGANPGSTPGLASSSLFGAAGERSRASAPPSSKKNTGPIASTGGDEEEGGGSSSMAKPEMAAPTTSGKKNRREHYSIQIEAVMDQEGANQLVDKLKRKGFEPYVVETQLNGRTWYRVRVGHYSTEDEAAAAQTRLRQEFAGAFTTQ